MNNAKYSFVSLIGSGMSSDVFLAVDRQTKARVAIKRIAKSTDAKALAKVRLEISIMKQIHCPFIVAFYDTYEDDEHVYIVMEHCQGGSLKDYLNSHGALREDPSSVLFTELALALNYLHTTCKTMHRDIKLDNILLDANGHVKLSDFGFSTVFDSEEPCCRTVCGSPAYASPELILRNAYTSKTDVWSAGVALFALVTGGLPFIGQNICECMKRVVTEEPTYPVEISQELRHLLGKLLEKNCDQRYDIKDVLNHPWLTEGRLYREIKNVSELRYETVLPIMNGEMDSTIAQSLGTLNESFVPGADRPHVTDSRSQWFLSKALARPGIQPSKSLRKQSCFVALRQGNGQSCPRVFDVNTRRRSIARQLTVSPMKRLTFTACD